MQGRLAARVDAAAAAAAATTAAPGDGCASPTGGPHAHAPPGHDPDAHPNSGGAAGGELALSVRSSTGDGPPPPLPASHSARTESNGPPSENGDEHHHHLHPQHHAAAAAQAAKPPSRLGQVLRAVVSSAGGKGAAAEDAQARQLLLDGPHSRFGSSSSGSHAGGGYPMLMPAHVGVQQQQQHVGGQQQPAQASSPLGRAGVAPLAPSPSPQQQAEAASPTGELLHLDGEEEEAGGARREQGQAWAAGGERVDAAAAGPLQPLVGPGGQVSLGHAAVVAGHGAGGGLPLSAESPLLHHPHGEGIVSGAQLGQAQHAEPQGGGPGPS